MNITGKHLLGKRLLKECAHRSSPSNRSVQAPYAEPNRYIGATPQVKHPVQLNYINLMLRLNCFFQAKEGRYEEALDAALALVAASQKEEGCVSYDVFESGTRANMFMICETWASQEAPRCPQANRTLHPVCSPARRMRRIETRTVRFPR